MFTYLTFGSGNLIEVFVHVFLIRSTTCYCCYLIVSSFDSMLDFAMQSESVLLHKYKLQSCSKQMTKSTKRETKKKKRNLINFCCLLINKNLLLYRTASCLLITCKNCQIAKINVTQLYPYLIEILKIKGNKGIDWP